VEEDVKATETLLAVAAQLREWLPELGGRALAVTEAEVTKDNVPTLPLAMVAPLIQNFTHNGGMEMTVAEEFMIEIWLKPDRIKGENGETPFWSYYEYNKFRDKLFTKFGAWRTPQNGTLVFVSMDVESNYLATVLSFRMRAQYVICVDEDELECPAEITFSLCQPKSAACPPQPEQEKDPCQPST
jgi:hypothetical protein